MEMFMKKILITTAAASLMCGSAFAQTTTGPAAQGDNMTKPGMTNDSMDKGSMKKGTTGMSSDQGSKKPDASGQGGSGPGTDQGGTRVSPNKMK